MTSDNRRVRYCGPGLRFREPVRNREPLFETWEQAANSFPISYLQIHAPSTPGNVRQTKHEPVPASSALIPITSRQAEA